MATHYEFLRCEEEKDNEYDKHAVAIIYDSLHSKKVVGHIPLYWSELANKFLKFPNHHICVVFRKKMCVVFLAKE